MGSSVDDGAHSINNQIIIIRLKLALPSSSVFPGLLLNQPSVISNMLNRAVAF